MDYAFSSLGPAVSVLALIVLFAFSLLGLAVLVYLAGLPGRVAARRGHPQADAVNVCGWVGLPTGFFWIAALVWAFWRPREGRPADLASLADELSQLERAVALLEERLQGARS